MTSPAERLKTALSDRYRIERELGRGGMAAVYLGEDLKHHRSVAIKVLDPELAAAIGADRFLREIEVAARLNHPHILPLHDSGSAGDLLYYVMPYAEGESLRQRLEREKQFPLAEALRIAHEVADALDYAHRRGVVHRDIKPENILLQERHAVVADFGIARAIAVAGGVNVTTSGIAIGTPVYMSPEQATGRGDIDGRSDVYSLGCVVYEMLAGQPPFTGPTSESLVHQHLSVEPRSVAEIRPAVPAGIAQALRRALAKTPADRYETAARFAEALADRGSAAMAEAPAPSARRLPRLALLGLVVLVVAAGAVLMLRPSRRAPAPDRPAHARNEVAVLPFQNVSTEAANAYFAGGLHDELLTQLSKVAALKVISRTSVMGYQGTSKPLRQIAEELGVGSVVEGSVQTVGQRLRVNVQLIDAATDEQVWSERYDRTLDDAFAIQSDVAQRIVTAVGAALTGGERGDLAAAPTANAEAYRLYLQAREYQRRPGVRRKNLETAQQLYEQALAQDPSFALAHAGLSIVHGYMHFLVGDSPQARRALQREEAETALRLAPDLPQAHIAMGVAHYYGRRDYRRALQEFAIASQGLPNDGELWDWIGAVHRRLGDWKETLAAFEKAAELDPRNADLFHGELGHTYWFLRRYGDALRTFRRALILAPDVQESAFDIGWIYFDWQGQLDSLRATLERVPRDAKLETVGLAYARANLLLWEHDADALLQMPETAGANVLERPSFMPTALYVGWAHHMRGQQETARSAFASALASVDSVLIERPEDARLHYARGMALAGLGRRNEARREARWIEQSVDYREDAYVRPDRALDRALILAQIGDADAACDEIERLLPGPSNLTARKLRQYPLWDPIRDHPRFKALLVKYGSGEAS